MFYKRIKNLIERVTALELGGGGGGPFFSDAEQDEFEGQIEAASANTLIHTIPFPAVPDTIMYLTGYYLAAAEAAGVQVAANQWKARLVRDAAGTLRSTMMAIELVGPATPLLQFNDPVESGSDILLRMDNANPTNDAGVHSVVNWKIFTSQITIPAGP